MRRIPAVLVWVLALVFLAVPCAPVVSKPTKALFLKAGQIFYKTDDDAAEVQLTDGDTPKFLPVWSKDGLEIAFAERRGDGLGTVVIIDEHGRRLEEVAIADADRGAGMRAIESLEWLSPRKIAITGSANPSLTETRLIDLDEMDTKTSIFDDGPGADFSPDGKHFAYISGSPHFTPERLRAPALHIDFRRVFPEVGVQVRFLTERVWSPDGKVLAVVAEQVATGKLTLVTWRMDGDLERRSLTLSAGDIQSLFWSGDTLLLRTADGVMRPTEDGRLEAWKLGEIADDVRHRVDMQLLLLNRLEGNGRTAIDFWCEDCAFRTARRKVVLGQ